MAYVAVAEEKSFSRAAEQLHTSQPAVSQHVQNLERRLSVKLLERSSKYVRLTKAGELVYEHGRQIMDLYASMERLVDDMMNRTSGPLSVGSSYTYGEYILPYAIAGFTAAFPEVNPIIHILNTREVVEQVGTGQLDLGITEGHYVTEQVRAEAFAGDEVVVVASSCHRLASALSVCADDLMDETWIIREEGSGTREITDSMLNEHHITPRSTMVFGSTQIIKESVEAGLGVTFLSKWTIRKELQLGTLTVLPFPEQPMKREFYLVRRVSEFHTKAMSAFADYLRDHSPSLADFF